MLKVTKIIITPSPNKNEEFTKLRNEVKNTIKNFAEQNLKIAKDRENYAKIIQQIKTEYQKISTENEQLRKYIRKNENEKQKTRYWQGQQNRLVNYQRENPYKRNLGYSSDEEDHYLHEYPPPKKTPENQKINKAWNEDEDDEFIENEDFIDGEGDPENKMLTDSENSGNEEPPEQIKKKP